MCGISGYLPFGNACFSCFELGTCFFLVINLLLFLSSVISCCVSFLLLCLCPSLYLRAPLCYIINSKVQGKRIGSPRHDVLLSSHPRRCAIASASAAEPHSSTALQLPAVSAHQKISLIIVCPRQKNENIQNQFCFGRILVMTTHVSRTALHWTYL